MKIRVGRLHVRSHLFKPDYHSKETPFQSMLILKDNPSTSTPGILAIERADQSTPVVRGRPQEVSALIATADHGLLECLIQVGPITRVDLV